MGFKAIVIGASSMELDYAASQWANYGTKVESESGCALNAGIRVQGFGDSNEQFQS